MGKCSSVRIGGVGALILTVHLLDLVDSVISAVLTARVNTLVEQGEN